MMNFIAKIKTLPFSYRTLFNADKNMGCKVILVSFKKVKETYTVWVPKRKNGWRYKFFTNEDFPNAIFPHQYFPK